MVTVTEEMVKETTQKQTPKKTPKSARETPKSTSRTTRREADTKRSGKRAPRMTEIISRMTEAHQSNGDVTNDLNDAESSFYDYVMRNSQTDKQEVKVATRSLNMAVCDFSGHEQYMFANYFFLHDPALVLLAFNMETYTDETFEHTLGKWLDWVVVKTNKITVIPVGLKADAVSSAKADEICESVQHLLHEHVTRYKTSIEKEIRHIESLSHINAALSEQLKSYIHLLKVRVHFSDHVVKVSAKEYTGVDVLLAEIENIAMNGEIFPNVMREIPSLWMQVHV